MSNDLIKLHLGCGGFHIDGWINSDIEVDIRSPLPYNDQSVHYIFLEHVIEHVTHEESINFFRECYRVLVYGGKIRICFPDIIKIYKNHTKNYLNAHIYSGWWNDHSSYPDENKLIKLFTTEWGHKALWDEAMMTCVLESLNFKVY
jgi:predicted SAM-dependent methyltransferase